MNKEEKQAILDEMDKRAIQGEPWGRQMDVLISRPTFEQIEWVKSFWGKYDCNEAREGKLAMYKAFKEGGLDTKNAWVRATYEYGLPMHE